MADRDSTRPRSERWIETGIRYRDGGHTGEHGYEVNISVRGKMLRKCFPPGTPRGEMRQWRNAMRRSRPDSWQRRHPRKMAYPAARSGWCFIYIIECAGLVKIGRTSDIYMRLRAIKTENSAPIILRALFPCHSDMESELHLRFKGARVKGEWFILCEELKALIEHVNAGKNPLTYLWPDAEQGLPTVLPISGN